MAKSASRNPLEHTSTLEIIEEVNDDLRQQKLQQFWKENGNWIIGGVIMAVALTGGLSAYRSWKLDRDMRMTGELIAAYETNDPAKLKDFSSKHQGAHAIMARFVEAGDYVSKKETDKALAAYDSIIKVSGVDSTWRDLAKIYSINLRLNKDKPESLHKELETLTAKGNAWRYSALELQALLFAREKKLKDAAETLDKIASDPLAPEGIRTRAGTLRSLYIAQAAQ